MEQQYDDCMWEVWERPSKQWREWTHVELEDYEFNDIHFLEMTNLKSLYLNGLDEGSKFDDKPNLRSLEKLTVSASSERALNRHLPSFYWFTQLRDLKLTNVEVKYLMRGFSRLTSLTHLNLCECDIFTLHPKIGCLTNLTRLSLFGNKLQSLPETIGNLSSLTELDLSCNNIDSLPNSFYMLNGLRRLFLWDNKKLSKVDIGYFTLLINLEVLSMFNSNITEVPNTFSTLTSLKRLEFGKRHFGNNLHL